MKYFFDIKEGGVDYIKIGDNIKVTIPRIEGKKKARIGISAPKHVKIIRTGYNKK